MSVDLAQPRFMGDRSIVLPCDCAGTCHVVVIAEWMDEDDPQSYVEFYAGHRHPHNFRERVVQTWRAFRGADYFHAVVWNEDQVARLGTWISQHGTPVARLGGKSS